MLLTEWNTEDAIAWAREEGREEGREEAREEWQKYFMGLIEQGLSLDDIKLLLRNTSEQGA